jgi:hypothetical protein
VKTRVSPLSPQPVILAVMLLVLAAMFAVAVQPEFRGGGFVTSVLAIAIGLVLVLLVRALLDTEKLTRDDPEDDVPLKLDEREGLSWSQLLLAATVMVGLFLSVMLFGIVIGVTVAVFAILRLHMRVPARTAGPLALVWGVVIPVGFSTALEVAMWPGLIPELIPRWVGGGLLSPL